MHNAYGTHTKSSSQMEKISADAIFARVTSFRASGAARVLVSATAPTDVDAASLLQYRVPKLNNGGGCALNNAMEPEPFNLASALEAAGLPVDTSRVASFRAVCESLAKATGADWAGIYQTVPAPTSSAHAGTADLAADAASPYPALLKLAYVGAPSRAYFPLTEAFAASSNNSTVAMTHQAVHIANVAKLDPDAPYYQCDAKVNSELCAPILVRTGEASGAADAGSASASGEGEAGGYKCIGIIDCEAFAANAFSAEAIDIILDVCVQLGESGLLTPSA